MQTAFLAFALAWAFFGHVALCLAMGNRAHATGMPIRWGKVVWLLSLMAVLLVPALFGYWFWVRAVHLGESISFSTLPLAAFPYLATCWLTAAAVVVDWFRRKLAESSPDLVRSDRRRVFQLLRHPSRIVSPEHDEHFLVRLPGNQILELDVAERGLELPGLPQALDGFTVLHLSDLHFTGRVPKAYFEELVDICNDLEPDLVAVTGDLIDNPACLDWIPDTLGRLKGRYGCYFVLGNHDLEIGARVLRVALKEAGLVDLGGSWMQLSVGDADLVLGGNELPWLPPAADLSEAPLPASEGGPVRVVLSHSPDQLPWAQRNHVDLLLAGHLHGGQIRVPLVGPLVSPSWHGVRYASGVFWCPPTVMHVSRGISGEIPLRLNCRPEAAKLTLRTVPLAGDHSG